VGAKALDLLRGLLPAASLSHMGIYASGQTYEQLILHLLAHPLPEARRTALAAGRRAGGHAELRRPGGAPGPRRGVDRLPGVPRPLRRALGHAAGLDRPADAARAPVVRLLHVDGDEEGLLAALLFEASGVSEEDARSA
jgi:hypothetical protein